MYDGTGEFVLIVVLDGSCDIDGISEADAYADCDGNKDNVEMAVADIVLKGEREDDCADDDVRLTSGEGDNVVDSVVVLELVKDWLGLDECVAVLELVVDEVMEEDRDDVFVALGLAVCDTDTLDDFDGEVLSVGIDEIDGYTDCDTDILDDSEGELVEDKVSSGVDDTLCVELTLGVVEIVAESLYDNVFTIVLLGVVVLDLSDVNVYVGVTVCVTPVGNVVILGLPVLTTDCVTDVVLSTVELRVIDGEGLDDCDFVINAVLVIDTETLPDDDGFLVSVTVVEDDADLLDLEEDV